MTVGPSSAQKEATATYTHSKTPEGCSELLSNVVTCAEEEAEQTLNGKTKIAMQAEWRKEEQKRNECQSEMDEVW